jgi:hypothetical protein
MYPHLCLTLVEATNGVLFEDDGVRFVIVIQ